MDSFDNPYLPFSLSDFWKRWNRFAGLLLKDIAFDPIIEGTLVKKRSGEDISIAREEGHINVLCEGRG